MTGRNARRNRKSSNQTDELKEKIEQVKSVTQWPDEDIIAVLENCNYDVQQAVENIVEGFAGTEPSHWTTVSKKKPKEPAPKQKTKPAPQGNKGKINKANGEQKKRPKGPKDMKAPLSQNKKAEKAASTNTVDKQISQPIRDDQNKPTETEAPKINELETEVQQLQISQTTTKTEIKTNWASVLMKKPTESQAKPLVSRERDQTRQQTSFQQKTMAVTSQKAPSIESVHEAKPQLPSTTPEQPELTSPQPNIAAQPNLTPQPPTLSTQQPALASEQTSIAQQAPGSTAQHAAPRSYHPPGMNRAWKPKQGEVAPTQTRTSSVQSQPLPSAPTPSPVQQSHHAKPVVTMPANISSLSSSPVTLPPTAVISSDYDSFHFGTIDDSPHDSKKQASTKPISRETSQGLKSQSENKAEKKDQGKRAPVEESVPMHAYPIMPGSHFMPPFPAFTGFEGEGTPMRSVPMYPDLNVGFQPHPYQPRDPSTGTTDPSKYSSQRQSPNFRGEKFNSQDSQSQMQSSSANAPSSPGAYYSHMFIAPYMHGQFFQNQIPQPSMAYRRYPYAPFPNSYPSSGSSVNFPEDIPQEYKNSSFPQGGPNFPYIPDQTMSSLKNSQASQSASSSKSFSAPSQNGSEPGANDLMGSNFKSSQTYQNRDISQQPTSSFYNMPQQFPPQGSSNFQFPQQATQPQQSQQYQIQH